MKNNENILILLLVVTGGILIAMLIGSWNAQSAYAATSADRLGDYIMVTGAMTPTRDLLYVVDVPNKRMVVYYSDPLKGKTRFEIADDRVNLANVFRFSRKPQ